MFSANVPGPANRGFWRRSPDPAPVAAPANSGHPIGEFILDSFGSPQADKRAEQPQQDPRSEQEPPAPSFVDQVGSGIGKMFRGIVTGK